MSNDGVAVKMNNLQSSLKYFDFEGMTKEQIIDKYEETLCQREKQIRDIAFEIGIINEKLCNSNERIKVLEEENENLNNKLLKKNTLLEQELTNKDIMFIKLNNLENDNDRLMQVLRDNGISLTSQNKKENKKSFFSGLMDKFSNKKTSEEKSIQLNIKKEENKNTQVTAINNITNSISASITTDLLSSIDLNQVSVNLKKDDLKDTNKLPNQAINTTSNIGNTGNTASTATSNLSQMSNKTNQASSSINKSKYTDKNPLNRLSMPSSREKRLATESIDYEPVFK